ncbi:MAG: hypothetical protein VR64_02140 [Desulfatitalea sp. BRH_c12]|nr:MAG: hypothetical protein VR64_02140 [Desulfatitalea sp. BRH_c12]
MFSKRMALVIGLIILITLSILTLSLSSRQPKPAFGPGRFAIAIVAPFQRLISHVNGILSGVWGHYFFLVSVAKENDRLLEQMAQADTLHYQNQELLQENERLRQLLSLGREIHKPVVAARVVGKDPSPWFQTILVDKGVEDGVHIGSPVIDPKGIVGLVVEVTDNYAKVMLITDPNSAVDAIDQRSRARGIIKGGTSGYCVLNYVLRNIDLDKGDTLISSGMDGVFPKGVPIGKIEEITRKEVSIFQEVTVTPFVDFERLEEVLIVPLQESVDPL